jgi:NADH-quinone oxidoreductase subunit L
MSSILQLFILIPLGAFLLSTLMPPKQERLISGIVLGAAAVQLIGISVFIGYWGMQLFPALNKQHMTLFKTGDIDIFIDFYFDRITAVFAWVGALFGFLVGHFSRFYLHREAGFKRYFTTLLLFLTGYNLIIFSGNFETLFMGWELAGIASFLLISFYRDRYLPVKNALKVISIFRLGDICLILAMWMSHHLWHENITFVTLSNLSLVEEHLVEHYWFGVFLSSMLILGAAIKSAQMPFTSWLPRAMEGPTSSSAIFYGALSVHLGVFLLLRTYPYWESLPVAKAIVIVLGLATCIIASCIARVQSTVKTQIAYASAAQIGLMFIEIALDLQVLALIHFAGNAFLRTYQLLVSPSVLSYLTHDMFFNFRPSQAKVSHTLIDRLKSTVYLLSIKEWNSDWLLYRYFWSPFKWLGNLIQVIPVRLGLLLMALGFGGGVFMYIFPSKIPLLVYNSAPFLYAMIGFLLILKTFTVRGSAIIAWGSVVGSQLFLALAIALLNEHLEGNHIMMYLSGTLVAALVGYICLKKIQGIDQDISLNKYHGYNYEKPQLGLWFLMACLGIVGFPFTPTFIGIDLLFSHIHKQEVVMIIFVSLSFLFIEISVLRIYARIFLGLHKKAFHPIAYKSS